MFKPSSNSEEKVRFGQFTLDLATGELHRNGRVRRLAPKPAAALMLLVERAGQIVGRDELQALLWGTETFVEFEDGLNHVLKRVRDALGDSADNPVFIETIPGRGYRFIQPVERLDPQPLIVGRKRHRLWGVVAVAAPVLLLLLLPASVSDPEGKASTADDGIGPSATTPAVAVLPLRYVSAEPGRAFWAEAFTDALHSELSRISALELFSRTSTSALTKGASAEELGRALEGLTHFVEGSLLASGDDVEVRATLVEAISERILWSGSYRRSARDFLALRGEMAAEIARAVQVEVTPDELTRLQALRPIPPEVYGAYLSGVRHFGAGNLDAAIRDFQKTIKLDRSFAPAYSRLADSYIQMGWFAESIVQDELESAERAARHALRLQDSLAEPHLVLAQIKAFHHWDWKGAEQEFLTALALNPNHAPSHLGYATFLLVHGRRSEAEQHIAQALRIDPHSSATRGSASNLFRFARRYDRALAEIETALQLEPDGVMWHTVQACTLLLVDQYDAAAETLKTALALDGTPVRPKVIQAHLLMVTGRQDEGRRALSRLESGNGAPVLWAGVYALTGDSARAFEILEEALEKRWIHLPLATVNPFFDPLRDDPRYADLLRRMGLQRVAFDSPTD